MYIFGPHACKVQFLPLIFCSVYNSICITVLNLMVQNQHKSWKRKKIINKYSNRPWWIHVHKCDISIRYKVLSDKNFPQLLNFNNKHFTTVYDSWLSVQYVNMHTVPDWILVTMVRYTHTCTYMIAISMVHVHVICAVILQKFSYFLKGLKCLFLYNINWFGNKYKFLILYKLVLEYNLSFFRSCWSC